MILLAWLAVAVVLMTVATRKYVQRVQRRPPKTARESPSKLRNFQKAWSAHPLAMLMKASLGSLAILMVVAVIVEHGKPNPSDTCRSLYGSAFFYTHADGGQCRNTWNGVYRPFPR